MAKELIEPMEFFKIDKISDDVYVIGPNVILKFNVSLSKISNGKRYYFHKEYEYPTRGIPEMPTAVSIKRSFDYYLSIETIQKDINGSKLFIRIGPQEYIMVKQGLEAAISWFTDTAYKNLFATNKGELILTSPIPEFNIGNLPMGKYIHIMPIIIDRGIANADKSPGIRLTLNDSSTFVDITLDRLMGLYYTISCFNMYQAALLLLNYLQRPEIGTGRMMINGEPRSMPMIEERSGADGVEGRFVAPRGMKNNIELLEG